MFLGIDTTGNCSPSHITKQVGALHRIEIYTIEKMNWSTLFCFLSRVQLILQGSRVARIKDLRNKWFWHCCSLKQWDYLEIALMRSVPGFFQLFPFFFLL